MRASFTRPTVGKVTETYNARHIITNINQKHNQKFKFSFGFLVCVCVWGREGGKGGGGGRGVMRKKRREGAGYEVVNRFKKAIVKKRAG